MVITSTLDKKIFEALLLKILKKKKTTATVFALDTAKLVGFHYATSSGLSISLDDLKTPKEKEELLEKLEKRLKNISKAWLAGHVTERERFQAMIDGWIELSEDVKDKIIDNHQCYDPLNNLFLMAFSGARGTMAQVRQIIGMRGLMTDQSGNVIDIPISSSFRQGLTVVDYIISAYGARKGVVDTALRTADAGYLTRRLVYIGQNIVIKEIDCKTTTGICQKFLKTEKLQELTGKIILSIEKYSENSSFFNFSFFLDRIVAPIDISFLSTHLPLLITYRSSFTCHSLNSICQKCYGKDLSEFGEEKLIQLGESVGIFAAQSIGEPGTQMTMRTFHTGGVFVGQKIIKSTSAFAGKINFPPNLRATVSRDRYGKRNYRLLTTHQFELVSNGGEILKFTVKKGDSLYINKSTYIPQGMVVYEPQKPTTPEAKRKFRPLRTPLNGEIFFHRLFFLKLKKTLLTSDQKNFRKKNRNNHIFTLVPSQNFSKVNDPSLLILRLKKLKKKVKTIRKKFLFYFPFLKKLKNYEKLLKSKEKIFIFLKKKILANKKQQKKTQLKLLALLTKIDFHKIVFRRKLLERIYSQLKFFLTTAKKKILQLLSEKGLTNSSINSSREKKFLDTNENEEIYSNESDNERKQQALLHLGPTDVNIPLGNTGSIWIASGKNFVLPSESEIFFSSFFFKKKALATLKIVTPIAGILKVTTSTIHVSNLYSSFSIDLSGFQKTQKKVIAKISFLYKNLTYIDAHTIFAFLYIFPLSEEKLHKAKLTLWQEKIKVSAITSSDTWCFSLDPLNQEFAFKKNRAETFLQAGAKITPTITIPYSGKFLENDGFTYYYQKIFPIGLRSGDFFACRSGEFVENGNVLAYTSSQSLRNNDIIQGLPKIANILESRYSEPYARLANFPGFFCLEGETLSLFRLSSMVSFSITETFSQKENKEIFPFVKDIFFTFDFCHSSEKNFENYVKTFNTSYLTYNYGFYRSFSTYEKKSLYHNYLLGEHSYVSKKDLIDQNTFLASYVLDFFPKVNKYHSHSWSPGKFFFVGQALTKGSIDAQILVRSFFDYLSAKYGESYALFQSIGKIRFILLNSVQGIYISQDVNIANIHLELVIREMTSSLLIENGIRDVYENSFVKGEYCRFSPIFHLFNSLASSGESLGKSITLKDYEVYLKENMAKPPKDEDNPKPTKIEIILNKFFDSLVFQEMENQNYLEEKRKKISKLAKEKFNKKFLELLEKQIEKQKQFKFKIQSFPEEKVTFFFILDNSSSEFLLHGDSQAYTGLAFEMLTEEPENIETNDDDDEGLKNEEEKEKNYEDDEETEDEDEEEEEEWNHRPEPKFFLKEQNLSEKQKFFPNYHSSHILHTYSIPINFEQLEELQRAFTYTLKKRKLLSYLSKKRNIFFDLADYSRGYSAIFPSLGFRKNYKQILVFSNLVFLPILPFQLKGIVKKKNYSLVYSHFLSFSSNLDSFTRTKLKKESCKLPARCAQNLSLRYLYSLSLETEERFQNNFISIPEISSFVDILSKKNEIDWFFDFFSSIGEKFLEKRDLAIEKIYEEQLSLFFSFLFSSRIHLSKYLSTKFSKSDLINLKKNDQTKKKIDFSIYLANPICFLIFFYSFPSLLKKKEKFLEDKQKGMTFTPLILGITSASLAKSGILASAAFQEPKRILAKSSILGECDWFEGLKESVIAGKLIPGGSSLFNLRDSLDNLYYYHPKDDMFVLS